MATVPEAFPKSRARPEKHVGCCIVHLRLHTNCTKGFFLTLFVVASSLAGGIQSSVAYRGWVLKRIGAQHVLWIMSMAHPNQADRPQGSHHVSDGILVANDLDIGSGWQQSKQNWARPAVVGHWARMKCRNLCCVQDVQLHPFSMRVTLRCSLFHVISCPCSRGGFGSELLHMT